MGEHTGKYTKLDERVAKQSGNTYYVLTIEGDEKLNSIVTWDEAMLKNIKIGDTIKVTTEEGTNKATKIDLAPAGAATAAAPQASEESIDEGYMISNGKKISKKYIKSIQGKDFITAAGLLAIAHENGFFDWRVETMTVDFDKKTAYCVGSAGFRVMDKDDKVTRGEFKQFYGVGSATPENVTDMTRKHYVEMAETRAKGRALRTALNIDMVTAEELTDDATSTDKNPQAPASAK